MRRVRVGFEDESDLEILERLFDQTPACDAATDAALTERAAIAVRELLGQVKVVEDADGVFAEINLAVGI